MAKCYICGNGTHNPGENYIECDSCQRKGRESWEKQYKKDQDSMLKEGYKDYNPYSNR